MAKTFKYVTIKFICDKCEKVSGERKSKQSIFPYDEGWVYLHKFSFKLNDSKNSCRGDVHFCSPLCFKAFLADKIEGATEKEEKKK